MLSELKKIVEIEVGLEAADMKQTASILLERQFLYSDNKRDRTHYQRIINNLVYYTNLFDALNRLLISDRDFGLVGILPLDGSKVVQLHFDEIIMLLCLRLLYEEGIDKFEARSGAVFTDSEALLSRYEALAHQERPILGRLRELIRMYARHGLLEMEEEHDKVIQIKIRPAVRYVLTEGYIEQIETLLAGKLAIDSEVEENLMPEEEPSDESIE